MSLQVENTLSLSFCLTLVYTLSYRECFQKGKILLHHWEESWFSPILQLLWCLKPFWRFNVTVFFADLLFLLLALIFIIIFVHVLISFEACVHCGRLAVFSFWMRDMEIELLRRSPEVVLFRSVQTSYKVFPL